MVSSVAPSEIYDVGRMLLEAACAELDVFKGMGLGLGCPTDRRCLVPGAELAWDDCDCATNGLLAVHVKTSYPSDSFPVQKLTGPYNRCELPFLVVHYAVTILRCVPQMDDAGRPPPCDDLDAAARRDFADRTAVWRGVACRLALPINPPSHPGTEGVARLHLLQEQLSIGEQGACAGSELNVLVGLSNCVEC